MDIIFKGALPPSPFYSSSSFPCTRDKSAGTAFLRSTGRFGRFSLPLFFPSLICFQHTFLFPPGLLLLVATPRSRLMGFFSFSPGLGIPPPGRILCGCGMGIDLTFELISPPLLPPHACPKEMTRFFGLTFFSVTLAFPFPLPPHLSPSTSFEHHSKQLASPEL